jgi:hypothetical protein
MKKQAEKTHQYTIRGVPEALNRAIRARAKKKNVSVNRLVIDELTEKLMNGKKRDLSDLVGKWVDDPEFDAVIASQRQIDWDMWK